MQAQSCAIKRKGRGKITHINFRRLKLKLRVMMVVVIVPMVVVMIVVVRMVVGHEKLAVEKPEVLE